MSKLSVQVNNAGDVLVSGEITYYTVNDALKMNFLQAQQNVKVNFAGVKHSDSSGLALMVHWLREAKKANINLCFEAVPEKLAALAKVSNLDEILPIV